MSLQKAFGYVSYRISIQSAYTWGQHCGRACVVSPMCSGFSVSDSIPCQWPAKVSEAGPSIHVEDAEEIPCS